ncbi:hypothetical protein Q5P01_015187 [Channa striata]|uniref:Uncharacterized protein n=1 Tax=Channa striata TaxID=64152 RepID=A0AA88MIP4_CHASR|nr:hypothetical protein Q5P01_015187 [Channa striata]
MEQSLPLHYNGFVYQWLQHAGAPFSPRFICHWTLQSPVESGSSFESGGVGLEGSFGEAGEDKSGLNQCRQKGKDKEDKKEEGKDEEVGGRSQLIGYLDSRKWHSLEASHPWIPGSEQPDFHKWETEED